MSKEKRQNKQNHFTRAFYTPKLVWTKWNFQNSAYKIINILLILHFYFCTAVLIKLSLKISLNVLLYYTIRVDFSKLWVEDRRDRVCHLFLWIMAVPNVDQSRLNLFRIFLYLSWRHYHLKMYCYTRLCILLCTILVKLFRN